MFRLMNKFPLKQKQFIILIVVFEITEISFLHN